MKVKFIENYNSIGIFFQGQLKSNSGVIIVSENKNDLSKLKKILFN